MSQRNAVRDRVTSVGLWVGLTVAFLLASLAMVQIRCKVFGGFPCGDWPAHGYTWHFWPPFLLLLWFVAARAWSGRHGQPLRKGFRVHGEAASPMLGLVLAWAWYGLTDPQFHSPACTIPVVCHDVMPFSIVIWSLPWFAWASLGIWRAWRSGHR